jgi:hypothetical protein
VTELCFNLWYYLQPTQTISALAGKAYLLDGTEGEKESMLRSLSRLDYKTVRVYEVPSAIESRYPTGMPYGALKDIGVDVVFKEVFDDIASSLQSDLPFPDDKLFFATPLIDFGEGFAPAEIGDGFIKDRD